MSPDVRWERSATALWRRSGQTLVLKAPDVDEIVALDRAGLELWTELASPVTLAEVAERLADRFGVEPAQVAADLAPLLQDLESRRLVHRLAA